MTTVLFACVHNAGRSQMAAAWFNLLSDSSKARAISAGTDPGPRVHPEVVAAMNEVGVDLSGAPTAKLTSELAQGAQMLITMGCGDSKIRKGNLWLGSAKFATKCVSASKR